MKRRLIRLDRAILARVMDGHPLTQRDTRRLRSRKADRASRHIVAAKAWSRAAEAWRKVGCDDAE